MTEGNTGPGDEAFGESPAARPIWLLASEEDFAATELEAPIKDTRTAECHELSGQFRRSANEAKATQIIAAEKTYAMLAALTTFYFRPGDLANPFGPMMTMGGNRSPIPEDFKGLPSKVLFNALPRFNNPVLRTRVADVCWTLDRSRSEAASTAINGYVDMVALVRGGQLKFPLDINQGVFDPQAIKCLQRALQISQVIGRDKVPSQRARALVLELRNSAVKEKIGHAVLRLSELDLQFGISEPQSVASDIETVIPGANAPHLIHALWKLAAQGFHDAKKEDDTDRCRVEAAECLVKLAESNSSPLFVSHWLSVAISEYHGIQGQRERRTTLRHRLLDVQATVSEEMGSFSHEIPIKEFVEQTEKAFATGSLIQKLGKFVSLVMSPDLGELRKTAIEQIAQSPLSSLFSMSHLDAEGKVIHRSEGATLDSPDDQAISEKIAMAEGIRRQLVCAGGIEVARRMIISSHNVGEDELRIICDNSPFVPPDQQITYAHGFMYFFRGDMINAVYTLTPQLENSLRYVLKAHNHDVTKINSDQTQEDRTISSLFDGMRAELESIFGPNTIGDIERVFLLKNGPYLRHQVAHGLLSDGAAFSTNTMYGCALIFRLCCLPLARYWDQIDEAHKKLCGAN